MELSLVIPTLNSSGFIKGVIEKILPELPANVKEVIIVDDSSADNTFKVLNEALVHPSIPIRLIRLQHNYGQAYATKIGIELATFDYVVVFDDDLQYPISEIHKLIQKAESVKDFQIVIGHKEKDLSPVSNYRKFTTTIFIVLKYLFIPQVRNLSSITSFVLINKKELVNYHPIYVWELKSSKAFSVSVNTNTTKNRKSNYTLSKYLTHFLPLLVFVLFKSTLTIGFVALLLYIKDGGNTMKIISIVLLLLSILLKLQLHLLKHKKVVVKDKYEFDPV
ncbi:MAG: glycosyltransferase family 2 protein [Chitinophagales bacterium]